ncbi:MAG: hypothetical protein R3B48_18250 [Kofleriaceae bacterium]
MNASSSGARRRAVARGVALAGLVVVAACEDPMLHVVVEPVAAYANQLERTEITVYERDGLTCDDIAFDRLSAEELRAIERSRGTSALTAIPRLGRKAVVARGYGRMAREDATSERVILAGCAEVDEIGEGERLVITTEPVVHVATDATVSVAGKGALEVIVVAVDVNQRVVDRKALRWTSYGPSGSFGAGVDQLEEVGAELLRGEGRFTPTPPSMAGPFAVQVRVKWSSSLPPLIASTMTSAPITRALGLPDPSFVNACAVYPRAGLPTLACLEKDSPTTRVVRSYRLQAGVLVQSAAPISAPSGVGVFPTLDGLVIVNDDGTYFTASGTSYSGSLCQGGCSSALADVLSFTGCTGQAAGLFALFVDGATPRLTATVITTNTKLGFPRAGALAMGAAGCVTDLEVTRGPQVAVTLSGTNGSSIYFLTGAAPIERTGERRLLGTGFVTKGREARLLTTEIDPTGFVVVESVLSKPGDAYRLFERQRSPAVSPPRHYVSGVFDLDGDVDLAWDVVDSLDSQVRYVQVLLAERAGRPTLSGRLPMTETADLIAADLDGDEVAEIIGYSNNAISIQRLGALR